MNIIAASTLPGIAGWPLRIRRRKEALARLSTQDLQTLAEAHNLERHQPRHILLDTVLQCGMDLAHRSNLNVTEDRQFWRMLTQDREDMMSELILPCGHTPYELFRGECDACARENGTGHDLTPQELLTEKHRRRRATSAETRSPLSDSGTEDDGDARQRPILFRISWDRVMQYRQRLNPLVRTGMNQNRRKDLLLLASRAARQRGASPENWFG